MELLENEKKINVYKFNLVKDNFNVLNLFYLKFKINFDSKYILINGYNKK